MEEEKLDFGAVSSAVKIGETIHRQAGAWTPTIHALLKFLADKGYPFSPTPLGMDERGREILNYLQGSAAARPWSSVMRSRDGLDQSAKMLRSYHEVIKDFQPPLDAIWRIGKVPMEPGQIIRHGDLGPWNTLWQEGKLTGLIDWDFAEPGDRITDLAQMAYYFVPLRSERGWRKAGFTERPDFNDRLDALCSAYGRFTVDEVLAELDRWLTEELRRTQVLGGKKLEPWATFLKRGDDTEIPEDLEWLRHRLDSSS